MEERETGARPEKEPKCKIFSEPDTPPCVGVYDNRQKGGPPVRQEESSGGGTEEMQSRGRSAPALRPLSAGRWIVMFFLTQNGNAGEKVEGLMTLLDLLGN